MPLFFFDRRMEPARSAQSPANITISGDVWQLTRTDLDKIPYFKSAMDGRWQDGGGNVINLGPQGAEGSVTTRGLEAALKWAYAGNPPVTVELWREVVGTAMFLGCLDAKYLEPLSDLVRYEEVNVFDAVEWITAKTEWLATPPASGDADALHTAMVTTIVDMLFNRLAEEEWRTRCVVIPEWILTEMLRRGAAQVLPAMCWLAGISKAMKTERTRRVAVEGATGEPPSKRAKQIEGCWAHGFLSNDQTRKYLEWKCEYPQRCPICSDSESSFNHCDKWVRTKHLRPDAPTFPFEMHTVFGSFSGDIAAVDIVSALGAVIHSVDVWKSSFKPSAELRTPFTRVWIETHDAVFTGALGEGPLPLHRQAKPKSRRRPPPQETSNATPGGNFVKVTVSV